MLTAGEETAGFESSGGAGDENSDRGPAGGRGRERLHLRDRRGRDTVPAAGATALVRTSMGITDEYGTYGYVFDTIYFYVGQVAVELDVTNIQDVPPPIIEQGLIDQIADKLTNQ
ncbi:MULTISPECIES: hypothetical protein [unclassified Parafrankia]|uniref:hypothetical protein n=1 Tax=unclassified Parafrankia TaxID=2994368 RepID=UPI000DA508AC|nr:MULTISPECIES: hypothetical protein [unclassified Parafrankia]CAI7981004.1 hypothetical protein FRAHR75_950015 [Frankia sp. Hr75.2]SQD94560.1 hypothetical protein FMEAI12_2630023 [Parafrankia sp. Ea1.12]